MRPLVVTRYTDHTSPQLFAALGNRANPIVVAITWVERINKLWYPRAQFVFDPAYCVAYSVEGEKGPGRSGPIERIEFYYVCLPLRLVTGV